MPIAGKDGTLSVGANAMAYIDTWNLTINIGSEEVSGIGSDWKEFLPTVRDWSGSGSGSFDPSDPAQKAMMDMVGAGGSMGSVAIELALDAVTSFAGDCNVTSIALGGTHAGKVTFSFNFQGTGELTPTLPVAGV
jgi:predicted secreted protein